MSGMREAEIAGDEIRYVEATPAEPQLERIRSVCSEMARRHFRLSHVVPGQSEDGRTVGLWLFFASSAAVPQEMSVEGDRRASWWRDFRERNRGLGASLTITGVVAVVSGFALHFALKNSWIDTTIHLGYFFGLVGLFLFLIGLLIVL